MSNRCGIGVFTTGKKDPMIIACEKHDKNYVKYKLHGGEKLRAEVDARFLQDMKEISKNRGIHIKAQSYLYYSLARLFGWIPWYLRRDNGN